MTFNRRQFIQTSAAASLIFGAVPLLQAKTGRMYRAALIGSGWWGMNLMREALASGQIKAVALCDVDPNPLEVSAEEIKDLTGDTPKTYRDYRELLDKEDIDIAIIATPDHWHALQAIAVLKAGAHVFVEKPTGHTVYESKALRDTARASGKTVQVGLHRRIGPHHVSGMKFLKNGAVGDIGAVKMFVVGGGGGPESPTRNSPAPDGMDWDLYCGPSPMRPFNRKIHPGGFRNFMDFANGTLGDWGVHWLDQVLWWTDEKHPKRIFSSGGRPVSGPPILNDTEQTTDTPDSQVAVYDFESFTATWEHRKFGASAADKHRIGCYFHGTKGTFHMGWRDGWTFYPSAKNGEIVHEDSQLQEPDGHNIQLLWADFLNAIETGNPPVSDIEIGHRATTLSLLGMLSLKLGRSVEWDGKTETIIGDTEASKLLSREYRAPWEYPI
jgi:predicted dehydrogenase